MNKSEEFIEKYKHFEDLCRRAYDIPYSKSIPAELRAKHKLQAYESEISYCQDVRNLLQHKYRLDEEFAVVPSEAMLQVMNKLINLVENRPLCLDVAIPAKSIYSRRMEDKVWETMLTMRARKFSHVPILTDGVLTGIFDENTMFSYLCEHGKVEMDEQELFSGGIKDYLGLYREMEEFCFVSKDTYVEEVLELYESKMNRGKRLAVIFVTKTGKPQERVLGLLTPWDILREGVQNL